MAAAAQATVWFEPVSAPKSTRCGNVSPGHFLVHMSDCCWRMCSGLEPRGELPQSCDNYGDD